MWPSLTFLQQGSSILVLPFFQIFEEEFRKNDSAFPEASPKAKLKKSEKIRAIWLVLLINNHIQYLATSAVLGGHIKN